MEFLNLNEAYVLWTIFVGDDRSVKQVALLICLPLLRTIFLEVPHIQESQNHDIKVSGLSRDSLLRWVDVYIVEAIDSGEK